VAERPILKLPPGQAIPPKPGPRAVTSIVRPGRDRQRERLSPKFERLERLAQRPADLLALRSDPASIAPERAIVFEVEGALKDFFMQAAAIGMDYLGDFDEDFDPSEDFYDEDDRNALVGGRVYLAMPDVRALQELLSRWRLYKTQDRMPRGTGAWGDLFRHLLDVRPWGPQDRIEPEAVAAWREQIAQHPGEAVRIEVELWFFEQEEKRQACYTRLNAMVQTAGGSIVHYAVVPEIRYHAALVELPAGQIEALIATGDVDLLRADDVMFLRPQSIFRDPIEAEFEGADGAAQPGAVAFVSDAPVVALLDGLPIQNHNLLSNRLLVDDPENLDATYLVAAREHGTLMASLICHGDLNNGETPLQRPIYVRPILQPDDSGAERSPSDRLFVDVVYQAVRRIKVGEAGQPSVAPTVFLINFSIGDVTRPFARVMSPLARLLDYLSYEYKVLFLVSAGNILHRFDVPEFKTMAEYEAATPEDREKAILAALNGQKSRRTLLAPAEAMNVLTIGAAHKGSAFNGILPAGRFDPFLTEDGPNVASAMGLGFRKIVKPEILLDGGRAPIAMASSGDVLSMRPVDAGRQLFGLKAAMPSPVGGTAYEDFCWGTSPATALATRAAHLIHDSLLDEAGGSKHVDIEAQYLPLAVKALLVHCAKWGSKGELLDGVFPPQGQGSHNQRRDDITRLLGYGSVDIQRVLDCTENRATMLGYSTIRAGEGLLYRIPLPDDIEGQTLFRSLTTTLAWFTPVNTRHQGYRRAALDISPGNAEDKYWLVADRYPYQPTDKAVARGTIFHEIRTSEEARVFVDDGHLLLRVSCRATAGEFDDKVPFALAVSFEVGIDAGIEVYNKMLIALGAQIRAAVAAAP
jgi:hypothetical protein